MTHEQWLAERGKGIGGSDIGIVCGISKFKTRIGLWKDKTGQSERQAETDNTSRGHILEPWVANKLEALTGLKVVEPPELIITDAEAPYFKASVDRFIDSPEQDTLVEIKTAFEHLEQPKDYWIAQAQWYMRITGRTQAVIVWMELPYGFNQRLFLEIYERTHDLTMLDAFCDIKWKVIQHDPAYTDKLREYAHDFWNNHVLTMIPPEPLTAMQVIELYPETNGRNIEATEAVYDWVTARRQAKAIIKQQEEIVDEMTDKIACYMRDNQGLTYRDSVVMTYNSQTRTTIDTTRLKKEMPDVAKEYSKQSTTRVMLSKEK